MKYDKQPLDIPALLAMLKARGLTIGDEKQAGRLLGLVSYFHLANYLRPMEADKETHQYKPDSSFENAVALYRFDAALREIVFRAISNIEIALRSKMIHHFSLKYGAFWFTNMSICNDEHLFLENLNAVDREVRKSKEDYIKEHLPDLPKRLRNTWIKDTNTPFNKLYAQLCCMDIGITPLIHRTHSRLPSMNFC